MKIDYLRLDVVQSNLDSLKGVHKVLEEVSKAGGTISDAISGIEGQLRDSLGQSDKIEVQSVPVQVLGEWIALLKEHESSETLVADVLKIIAGEVDGTPITAAIREDVEFAKSADE